MKRGFTLVELMVVIVVIGILAGVTTLGYIKYQDQASLSHRKTVANLVLSSAKSYKNRNNQYPAGSLLSAQNTTGNPPTDNYQAAAAALGIQASTFSAHGSSLVPCNGAACVFNAANQSKIYYIAKSQPLGTAETVTSDTYGGNPGETCSYTFPATTYPNQDFMVGYFDTTTYQWRIEASSDKVATSNGFWCPYRTL